MQTNALAFAIPQSVLRPTMTGIALCGFLAIFGLAIMNKKAWKGRNSSLALSNGERLNFSGKLVRLKERMKDPEWRRYAKTLFAGKMLGLGA
ncbi:MAG TPA: hypothetical protein VGG19_12635, partial [Tepidisphaeraceae bacterium]